MSRCNTCKFCIRKEPYYDVKCTKLQRHIYDAKDRVWCDYYQCNENKFGYIKLSDHSKPIVKMKPINKETKTNG